VAVANDLRNTLFLLVDAHAAQPTMSTTASADASNIVRVASIVPT
jgi:hypothetical protein